MGKIDTIYVNIGDTELEVDGYSSTDDFEIEDIKVEGVSIHDLLLGLELHYKLNYSAIRDLVKIENEDYIDRVFNPDNEE